MIPFSPTRTGSVLLGVALMVVTTPGKITAGQSVQTGCASWYGEDHRGWLMANGEPFNPDKLTAASWFYPLGTKLRVELRGWGLPRRSVLVTVTDRGPAHDLVYQGRVIDLSLGAFRQLCSPDRGLVAVSVRRVSWVARSQPRKRDT